MAADDDFSELLRRVRAGDPTAATRLVQEYEPLIRREVRLMLDDSRLIRLFDSMDIVQSVMSSFFVRMVGGQYDLDSPHRLLGLLVAMARNKVISTSRRQLAQKRDGHRREASPERLELAPAHDDSPSQAVSMSELVACCRLEMSSDEQQVAELRSQDHSWEQVAGLLGGTADSRRVQMSRAIERISRKFGLDDT